MNRFHLARYEIQAHRLPRWHAKVGAPQKSNALTLNKLPKQQWLSVNQRASHLYLSAPHIPITSLDELAAMCLHTLNLASLEEEGTRNVYAGAGTKNAAAQTQLSRARPWS